MLAPCWALLAAGAVRVMPRSHVAMMGVSMGTLDCLPFPMDEALMVGETKQLHLFEARFLTVLERMLASERRGAAQVLFTGDDHALAYAPLLRVREWTRRDVGVNVVVECTGRLRLVDIHSTEPFITAVFDAHTDRPIDDADQWADVQRQGDQALALHAECRALRASVMAACDAGAADPETCDAALHDASHVVTWGHEASLPGSGWLSPLDDQLGRARAAAAAAESNAAAADGESDDAHTALARELELLSLVACAPFSSAARVSAIAMDDTAQRMDRAVSWLREHRNMLLAKKALIGVVGREAGATKEDKTVGEDLNSEEYRD